MKRRTKPAARPLRANLRFWLAEAEHYVKTLYQLEREYREAGIDSAGLAEPIRRAEADVDKLRRLTQ